MSRHQDPRERVIRNLFLLRRIENTLGDQAESVIRGLFEEITADMHKLDPTAVQRRYRKDRLEKLLKRIEKRIGPAFDRIQRDLREHLESVALTQSREATLTLTSVLGAGSKGVLQPVPITLAQARAIIREDPVHGRFLKDWFRHQATQTSQRVAQQIRLGMSQAESIGDIVRRVRGRATGAPFRENGRITGFRFSGGVMATTTREATAIVRTSVNHVANRAAVATYEKNGKATEEYRIVATLDTRTTPVCQAKDGETHRYDSPARELPPFHVNCRTIIVPIPNWAALGLEPPKGRQRASMDGPVDADMTYAEWLRGQPDAVRREVLGPNRMELFDRGAVSLDDMIKQDGSRVRLDELRALAGNTAIVAEQVDPKRIATLEKRVAARSVNVVEVVSEGVTLPEAEAAIRGQMFEHAFIYAPDGKTLRGYKTDSAPGYVNFEGKHVAMMFDGILTHNHPNGSSFSAADFAVAIHSGMREMRALSHAWDFSLKPKGHRVPDDIARNFNTLMAHLSKEHDELMRAGRKRRNALMESGMSVDEAWKEITHESTMILAERYGMQYARKKAKLLTRDAAEKQAERLAQREAARRAREEARANARRRAAPRPGTAAPTTAFEAMDPDEIVKWARKNYGKWSKGLKGKTLKYFKDYQADGHRDLNVFLRTGHVPYGSEDIGRYLEEFAAALEKAINKAMPVPQNLIAFRAVSGKQTLEYFEANVGRVVVDNGFVSTTLSRQYAMDFMRADLLGPFQAMIIEVRVPKGTRATYMGHLGRRKERELLLQRGTKFRIISVSEPDSTGLRTAVLEVVP